jgi:hypothetical protein
MGHNVLRGLLVVGRTDVLRVLASFIDSCSNVLSCYESYYREGLAFRC